MKNKKSGGTIKSVIFAVFFVALILFYFNYLSNRTSTRRTYKEKNDIDYLVDYDYISNYPKTVRDVVKLHNQYFQQFYGKTLSEEELAVLNKQVLNLYSSELMAINDEEVVFSELKKNIEKMREEGYSYKVCELPEASQIKFYTDRGREMATLEVIVTMDMKNEKGYVYQQYVLVKENEKWKILTWGQSTLNQNRQ